MCSTAHDATPELLAACNDASSDDRGFGETQVPVYPALPFAVVPAFTIRLLFVVKPLPLSTQSLTQVWGKGPLRRTFTWTESATKRCPMPPCERTGFRYGMRHTAD